MRPGGFSLAIGIEDSPGVPAPPEKMRLLGQSEFGSGYLVSEKIGDLKHHVHMTRHHRNWNPEDISWGLCMASMSISNIQSALKILNGVPADQVQFNWPSDFSTLLKPWKRSVQMGITSMTGFDVAIRLEFIDPFSKDTILRQYQAGKDAGILRIAFDNGNNAADHEAQDSNEAEAS